MAFACLVDSIFPQRHMRIREYECRQKEINSVLGKVDSILFWGPFELDRSIQVYIRHLWKASHCGGARQPWSEHGD
jgi:hypothetical protein